MLIPPYQSVRGIVMPIDEGALAIAQRGHVMIDYTWRTPMSLRYTQFREWMYRHASPRLQKFLKYEDAFRDATMLEVPPPPQPAP